MPNWCHNNLSITGGKELLDQIYPLLINEKKEFTFNMLFPMPEDLNITAGSDVDNGRDVILAEEKGDWSGVDEKFSWPAWTEGIDPKLSLDERRKLMLEVCRTGANMTAARQSVINEDNYGYKNWYDWRCEKWGTKWDACDSTIVKKKTSITTNFDTAWAPPIPWLIKIMRKYPDLKFELSYQNECEDETHYYPG